MDVADMMHLAAPVAARRIVREKAEDVFSPGGACAQPPGLPARMQATGAEKLTNIAHETHHAKKI
jgi:hypothetical protein